MYLELPARIVRSSSWCQVVLHLLSPILSFLCGSISFCFRRVVSRPRQLRPHVQPPPTHSRVPWAHPLHSLHTRALFLSFTRSVLAILSLYVFILDLPVKILSIIVLIRSRHSLLCGVVAHSCNVSAAQPGLDVCRQHVEFFSSTSGIISTTILGNGGPAPSLSDAAFCVNFNSRATICHAMPHKPSQFVAFHASPTVCLVQMLPRTNSVLVTHKTAPVRSS